MLPILYKKYKWHFFLLFSIVIGFWQLGFMVKIMKWDMLSYFFPMKYYAGECLSNGYFPYWNPHQFLGFPIHADPQSGVWYPITWIIGTLFGYNLYTINFEFLLHVFIGGCGILALGKTLKLKTEAAFLMAICYTFCGVYVGNAQHLSWVVSAAWIPYILTSVHNMFRHFKFQDALFTGFLAFLMLTGGYSGFFIILFYILLAYTISIIGKQIMEKAWPQLKISLKQIGVMAATFIFLSSGYIISIVKVLPYFSRGDGLTATQIMQYPFPLKSYLSFLLPYAVTTDIDYWGMDISMLNGYFGIIGLAFLLAIIFIKNNKKPLFLFALGCFFLLSALGEVSPIRGFMYHYIPGMSLFKYPSIFRYFALLCFILLVGLSCHKFMENIKILKFFLIRTIICLVLIIGIIVIYNINKIDIGALGDNITYLLKMKMNLKAPMAGHIVIQGVFQIVLLITLGVLLYKVRSEKIIISGILFLCIVDMVVATQFNMAATVISNRNFKAAQLEFTKLKHGFSMSNYENKKIIEAIPEKSNVLGIPGLYHNLNIFDKQIGFEGNNPFQLKNYLTFKESPNFTKVLENKIVYLSDTIFSIENMNNNLFKSPSNLFFDKKEFDELSLFNLKTQGYNNIELVSMEPNKLVVKSTTESEQIITLLQNYYPGWYVLINNKEAPYYISNHTFISAVLPPGKNKIEFIYRPQFEIIGLIASLVSLGLFILYITHLQLTTYKSLKDNNFIF